MTKLLSICCALAFIVTLSACDSQKPETTQEQAPQTQSAPAPETATPTEPVVKKGTVAEFINAAGYTYILVDDGQKKTWVAVMETPVKEGEEVSYYDGIVMQNLHSKTLDRTFDEVIFSNGLVGQMPMAPPAAMGGAHGDMTGAQGNSFAEALKAETGAMGQAFSGSGMGSGGKPTMPFNNELKIEKATGENSYTVAEIFAKGPELKGQKVTVRGKITKVSTRIMGLNWLHIQDGTGSEADATYDLVVTTEAEPQPDWDVVTVSGVLAADKDIGSGYFYKVILEQGEISK